MDAAIEHMCKALAALLKSPLAPKNPSTNALLVALADYLLAH